MAQQADPAPAAAEAVPPPPPVAAQEPCCYRELLLLPESSPGFNRMAGYLGGYRFAGEGDIRTPTQLRDQTVALADRTPMSFLCLTSGQDGPPEVSVIHRLVRFIDAPGEEPSGFNDRVIGLQGDMIMPHQYLAVEVPSSAFHLIGNAVRIPTVEAMEALVPTSADPQVPHGPFAEEHPETEVVRPRNTQLVPGNYAALIIHRRRVNPKMAYQDIAGAIRADGALDACADVLIWLRAACTARGGGGGGGGVEHVTQRVAPFHPAAPPP